MEGLQSQFAGYFEIQGLGKQQNEPFRFSSLTKMSKKLRPREGK
jgi:hypothetical protein